MKLKLTILLLLTGIFCFSQITNVRKWRKGEQDSMQNALLLYEDGKVNLALPMFEKLYKSHPDEEYLKFMYGRTSLTRSDKHEVALQMLTEVYDKNKKAIDIEYDLARANHYNYNFDAALEFADKSFNNKRTTPSIKEKIPQLRKYIINAKELYSKPTNAKITNAGPIVNSRYDEYVPVISADESLLIFTYVGIESTGGRQNGFLQEDDQGMYYEDVFQTSKVNDEWVHPSGIKTINTNSHDAAIALSPDGLQLFTYNDNGDDHGDIYVSYLNGNQWTVPMKLRGQVNSFSWEGSCSLTADGRTLYFASERGGGYGGRDIYKATLQADSTWGNIVNLGDSINTSLDDDAPFIHPDGLTLFYSSKGKNSMGDYDVFQSTMNPLDSTFKNATNLGYPINTPDGDRYYVLAANGKTGYYSSGKKGGQGLNDIYLVDPGYIGKKPSLYLVKGKITLDGQPVEATYTVDMTSKSRRFIEARSNVKTGNYVATLPAGATYKITYTYKEFAPIILDIDASAITDYTEKIFNIEFNPPKPDSATIAAKDGFVPKSVLQEKTKKYASKYGDIYADSLEFKVQIAAYKIPKNYKYNHLKGLGKVEKLLLGDGVTRITIGGIFKTIGGAYEHNKKVIAAGQPDAFVTAIYKGKRIYLEELEKLGIFKK